jgi:Kef-type K+ transport system membrane component KefB
LVGLFAAAAGVVVAELTHTHHPALYALLMASSSAALALPVLDSARAQGSSALEVTAQVAIADTVASLTLPIVVSTAGAGATAVGAAAVIATALAFFVVLRYLDRVGARRRLHRLSRQRQFALELRISLAVLFALAAIASATRVSVMLAGFTLGLAVAGVGEPRRVARQLFALNDGFLGPLFFVWLGARIDVRELGAHPRLIVLGSALGLAAVAVHALMRVTGQPYPLAVLAAAQLGVPAAAITIGTRQGVLQPGEPAAIIFAALITVAAATAAGASLGRRQIPLFGSHTDELRNRAP